MHATKGESHTPARTSHTFKEVLAVICHLLSIRSIVNRWTKSLALLNSVQLFSANELSCTCSHHKKEPGACMHVCHFVTNTSFGRFGTAASFEVIMMLLNRDRWWMWKIISCEHPLLRCTSCASNFVNLSLSTHNSPTLTYFFLFWQKVEIIPFELAEPLPLATWGLLFF